METLQQREPTLLDMVGGLSAHARPMRIVVLSNLYPPDVLGGYELLARDLVDLLRQRGHQVSVITTGTEDGVEHVHRSLVLARPFGDVAKSDRIRHTAAYAYNVASTRRFLRSSPRPDAVLVMSLRRLGLGALHAFAQAGIPLVVTVNDDWPAFFAERPPQSLRDLPRWALDRTLARVRWLRTLPMQTVVYLSGAVRDHVLATGVDLPPGRVLPQGVDLRVFHPRQHRPMAARPRLLFVGRLHPSKAPEVALETLAALRERGVLAELLMAGEPHDSRYGQSLCALATRLGIDDQVSWLGRVPRDQLPELYRGADLLLFASTLSHEGQGLTYLEAMACGLPVVAYPSGGAREFLDRHPAAERVDRLDGHSFADAVQRLTRDAVHQQRLVETGLEVVRTHACLDTYVAALENECMRVAG